MNLFDHSLRFAGYPLPAAKEKLRHLQKYPMDDPQKGLQDRLDIARYHLKNNPFYARFAGLDTIKSWDKLPIMTKHDLQQDLGLRLSKGFTPGTTYVGKTSGSSGQPFSFAKDKFCHALSWASFYQNYSTWGIDLSKDKQARFYGIPLHGAARHRERFKDLISGRYRFDIFDLSPSKMETFLTRFQNTPFTYINGYTSSVLRFAEFLNSKGIVLKNHCPSLKICIVTSEMLFDIDRQRMQTALGIPIVNEYGASETGLIAFENSKKQLLIDDLLLYVEVLDEQGNVLPYGEKGRVIITSLYNKAHPFIRYELGDLGSLKKDELTGALVLQELHGRTNDFARLPSGKTVPGLAFYYVTKKAMETTAGITEFIVTQTHRDLFTVTYVSKKSLLHQEILDLKKLIIAYLEPGITINFNQVAYLKRSASGKLKQFTAMPGL